MSGGGYIPPLSGEDNYAIACMIMQDWRKATQGRAGRTLTETDGTHAITARSKPLDVIAYRMRLYRTHREYWLSFLRRHNDGSERFTRLLAAATAE